jgi:hypothetical protein
MIGAEERLEEHGYIIRTSNRSIPNAGDRAQSG